MVIPIQDRHQPGRHNWSPSAMYLRRSADMSGRSAQFISRKTEYSKPQTTTPAYTAVPEPPPSARIHEHSKTTRPGPNSITTSTGPKPKHRTKKYNVGTHAPTHSSHRDYNTEGLRPTNSTAYKNLTPSSIVTSNHNLSVHDLLKATVQCQPKTPKTQRSTV